MTSSARYFKEGVGSSPTQLTLDHMVFGAAAGKHLVYGVRESKQLLLRSIGRQEGRNDVDEALDLLMCS
jgi:hypothetical protein